MAEQNIDHAQVMIAPPLVFLGYLIGVLTLHWIVPLPTSWTSPLRILGGLLVTAGLFLGGSAISQMTKAHTSPDPHQPTTALVTEGSYRFTRNPIYLGFLLIYLGFTLLAGTLWGLIASPFLLWTILHAVIHAEEDYLESKFGEQYTAYRSRVRRWF
jgi:protein-S-isoprenylcysteine O-methyltransferase Ste14